MARCLVMAERVVAQSDRASYLTSLAVRREGAAAASAHFWVFEDASAPGRFLEFVEAGSEEALACAIDAASDQQTTTTGTAAGSIGKQVVWTEVS